MAKSVGKIFAELDLDDSAYKKAQQDILRTASDTALSIEQTTKTSGVKIDAVYAQMKANAEKAFQAVAQSSKSSSDDIVEAEKKRTEALKKINEEQQKNSQESFDKIKDKLLELAETATYVAGVIATTLFAAMKGYELGGTPGGILGGSVALGTELYTAFSAANAQAADLDIKYQKLYDTRKQIQVIGLSEKQINEQVNALIGDQIASWDKIKDQLPDIVNRFLDYNKAMNTAVGTQEWSFDAMLGNVSKLVDDTINLFSKPKSEIEKLYESATESQQRALATQYIADKKAIKDSTASYQEKADAMKMINLKYWVESQEITNKGVQGELQSYQAIFEKVGSTSGLSSYPAKEMDRIVDVMKQKYGEMLRAQEDSDALLMGDKEKAHELMLAKEKEYGDKMLQIVQTNLTKQLIAQINENMETRDRVMKQEYSDNLATYNKFQTSLTGYTVTGHVARLEAIKKERDDTVRAYEALGKDVSQVNAAFKEKIDAENKRLEIKPDTKGAEEYKNAIEKVTDAIAKLTLTDEKYKQFEVANWYKEEGEVLGKNNALLQKAVELKNRQIELDEIKRRADMSDAVDASAAKQRAIESANLAEQKKYADEYLVVQTDLTDKINKLTLSQHDYKIWALDNEIDKLKISAGYEKSVQDDIAKYKELKIKEIMDSENVWLGFSKKLAHEMEKSFSDLFFNVITGKFSTFEEYLNGVMNSIARMVSDYMAMVARKIMFGSNENQIGGLVGQAASGISSWFSGAGESYPIAAGGVSAQGNIFSGRGISAFENQVISRPTVFPFARGIGLMGESGSEAIMPLTRTASGALGVKAQNSTPNVVVNIENNTGTPIAEPKIKFDVRGMVLDIVLDGMNRDVNGFRGAMGAR